MFRPLFNIFFPRICATCSEVLLKNEQVLCAKCLHHLPIIQNQAYAAERMKTHFYGRIAVEHSASLMFYHKKGLSQRLIHQLKYHGDERISAFLGKWLAANMTSMTWPKTVEIIIPVPLHKKRKRKRGFNQVAGFGRALADAFKSQYKENMLIKTFDSHTQVFKNRFSRGDLKTAFFALKNPKGIKNKHILLVDDLITTGSTLETCSRVLLKGDPSKISIATMAITI